MNFTITKRPIICFFVGSDNWSVEFNELLGFLYELDASDHETAIPNYRLPHSLLDELLAGGIVRKTAGGSFYAGPELHGFINQLETTPLP